MRLDCFIAQHYDTITRQKAAWLIQQGQVCVNGVVALKPSFYVDLHDDVEVKREFFIESKIFCSRAALKLQRFLCNVESNKHTYSFYDSALFATLTPFLTHVREHIDISEWQKAHDSKHISPCVVDSIKKAIQSMIKDSIILDVGASAGGFTQVLLAYKARLIVAQDIGTLQLDSTLRKQDAVISIENVDIRIFSQDFHIYKERILSCIKDSKDVVLRNNMFDFLVCDVSFISLGLILESLLQLSKSMLLLYKPQFEVGIQVKRDKRGVVQDKKEIRKSLESFIAMLRAKRVRYIFIEKSLLAGKEGNEEFFIFCQF